MRSECMSAEDVYNKLPSAAVPDVVFPLPASTLCAHRRRDLLCLFLMKRLHFKSLLVHISLPSPCHWSPPFSPAPSLSRTRPHIFYILIPTLTTYIAPVIQS